MTDTIIEKNKYVSFTYRILDENENIVEQSNVPMDYQHGVENDMFEKIENALTGKKVGEQIRITLNPDEGFGQPLPELIHTDSIDNVPPEHCHVGARPMFENDRGDTREMLVTKVENGKVTIDGNHPFAGKTITFIVEIDSINDKPLANAGTGPSSAPDTLH
jgi:FKBP-type peptidyl-prolyl cis-trans isomerase SlyD